MIVTDNAENIGLRYVDFLTLKSNVIVIHMKYEEKTATKTFPSEEAAKAEFDKLSKAIENYVIVKSGKPRIS